jgi:hypothetical protein
LHICGRLLIETEAENLARLVAIEKFLWKQRALPSRNRHEITERTEMGEFSHVRKPWVLDGKSSPSIPRRKSRLPTQRAAGVIRQK